MAGANVAINSATVTNAKRLLIIHPEKVVRGNPLKDIIRELQRQCITLHLLAEELTSHTPGLYKPDSRDTGQLKCAGAAESQET